MSEIMQLLNQAPWAKSGKCTQVHPDIFFTEKEAQAANKRAAKALCARCPSRVECLDFGIGERYGIWGGLDEKERRQLSKERRAAS